VDYVRQEGIVHLDQLPHLPALLENTVQVLELKQNSIVFHVILDSSVLGLVVQMPLRNVLLVITAQEEQEFLKWAIGTFRTYNFINCGSSITIIALWTNQACF
jgi:hypothetical protein